MKLVQIYAREPDLSTHPDRCSELLALNSLFSGEEKLNAWAQSRKGAK